MYCIHGLQTKVRSNAANQSFLLLGEQDHGKAMMARAYAGEIGVPIIDAVRLYEEVMDNWKDDFGEILISNIVKLCFFFFVFTCMFNILLH